MADQRRVDESALKGGGGGGETINRPVAELDNSGGDSIMAAEQRVSYVVEDENKLKKLDPKFGEWDSNSHGASDSYTSTFKKVREEGETLDFGRDTNWLAYFSVGAFNLHGDDDLARMTDYGGGGGGGGRSRQIPDGELANSGNGGGGEVVVGILDQKRDGGGSGGGDRSPQIAVRGFASHGDTVDQKGDGGGEGRGVEVTGWWEKWSSCWRCGK